MLSLLAAPDSLSGGVTGIQMQLHYFPIELVSFISTTYHQAARGDQHRAVTVG
jgi:hypothetical protein